MGMPSDEQISSSLDDTYGPNAGITFINAANIMLQVERGYLPATMKNVQALRDASALMRRIYDNYARHELVNPECDFKREKLECLDAERRAIIALTRMERELGPRH